MILWLACAEPLDTATVDSSLDSAPQVLHDLAVTGDNYPHIGQIVGISVHAAGVVAIQDSMVLSDNSIAFSWEDVLRDGVEYTVDWYADNNDSGACDDGDHAWVREIGAFTSDAQIVLDHVNAAPYDYDAACDTF